MKTRNPAGLTIAPEPTEVNETIAKFKVTKD
jgi:hypothetical protein